MCQPRSWKNLNTMGQSPVLKVGFAKPGIVICTVLHLILLCFIPVEVQASLRLYELGIYGECKYRLHKCTEGTYRMYYVDSTVSVKFETGKYKVVETTKIKYSSTSLALSGEYNPIEFKQFFVKIDQPPPYPPLESLKGSDRFIFAYETNEEYVYALTVQLKRRWLLSRSYYYVLDARSISYKEKEQIDLNKYTYIIFEFAEPHGVYSVMIQNNTAYSWDEKLQGFVPWRSQNSS